MYTQLPLAALLVAGFVTLRRTVRQKAGLE